MKLIYLFMGFLFPATLFADGFGSFENLPAQSSLSDVTKMFSLASPSPMLNKKGQIEEMGEVSAADPCSEEGLENESVTNEDGFAASSCRAILTQEQQKFYKKVDFKFVKLTDHYVLESIDIDYGIPEKTAVAKLTTLYGVAPKIGNPYKIKTHMRYVPGGDVAVWTSSASDRRLFKQSLTVYNNLVGEQINELTKLEKEEEFSCPKGTISDSQRKDINFKKGEEEESYAGYIAYCVNPKGARSVATYQNSAGFDKNGVFRRSKELAFKDTVYDPKSLNGPMWIWHLESRRLMEKRIYQNGKIISQEVVGKLPDEPGE